MKYLLYHENNTKYPYLPQEDSYSHNYEKGIFAVADGITHDENPDGSYPNPSDSAEVAKIITTEIVKYLETAEFSEQSIKEAFIQASQKVEEYNKTRPFYKDRESNGYTIGAAIASVGWVKENKLIYGVLDDCFISIFSEDYIDHPILKSYVDHSANYLDKVHKWEDIETRKHWRKDIRNNTFVYEGIEYGYGAIDGRDGFIKYLQVGTEDLKKDDLVCVYSDGFIPLLIDIELIKQLRDQPFTKDTYSFIQQKAITLNKTKEKTAYFIKND